MPYVGSQPTVGNFVKLDAIVTSATATYNLLNGGVAYTPASVLNMIVSLNGVIQEPTTASNVGGFTVSGSTIVFTSALTSLDVIDFILVLGDVLNIGTPSDGTVTFPKVTSNLITGATAEATIAGGDSVLIYDDSASALRKMTRTNFVAGIGNTPAFEARLSGNQTITNATVTKVQFATENFDTDSCYDNATNYRFTPTTAGKYYVYAKVKTYGNTDNDLNTFFVKIYKNGALHIDGELSSYPDNILHRILVYNAGIVDFNGTTDYVEIFVQSNGGQATSLLESGDRTALFGAYKLIGV